MEKHNVIIDGKSIEYYLIKKKIRSINIRVKTDEKIYVSCPNRMNSKDVEVFIIKKYNWIKKQQEKIREYNFEKEEYDFKDNCKMLFMGKEYLLHIIPSKENRIEINNENINIYIKSKYLQNSEYIKKYYEKWLKEEAYNICENRVSKYLKEMKKYVKTDPTVEIKKMKSRWGYCMPKRNKVVFNLNLIKTPLECIEYVVVHELSHFKEQNHSKNFYNIVEIYIPNWKELRKLLNNKYSIVV